MGPLRKARQHRVSMVVAVAALVTAATLLRLLGREAAARALPCASTCTGRCTFTFWIGTCMAGPGFVTVGEGHTASPLLQLWGACMAAQAAVRVRVCAQTMWRVLESKPEILEGFCRQRDLGAAHTASCYTSSDQKKQPEHQTEGGSHLGRCTHGHGPLLRNAGGRGRPASRSQGGVHRLSCVGRHEDELVPQRSHLHAQLVDQACQAHAPHTPSCDAGGRPDGAACLAAVNSSPTLQPLTEAPEVQQ